MKREGEWIFPGVYKNLGLHFCKREYSINLWKQYLRHCRNKVYKFNVESTFFSFKIVTFYCLVVLHYCANNSMGIRNWDFTRSKPSNFPLKLRGRIVTSLLTWTSFYHSVILFNQNFAHYAVGVCVCLCVCAFAFCTCPFLNICFLTCPFLFLYLSPFFSLSEKKRGKKQYFSVPFL